MLQTYLAIAIVVPCALSAITSVASAKANSSCRNLILIPRQAMKNNYLSAVYALEQTPEFLAIKPSYVAAKARVKLAKMQNLPEQDLQEAEMEFKQICASPEIKPWLDARAKHSHARLKLREYKKECNVHFPALIKNTVLMSLILAAPLSLSISLGLSFLTTSADVKHIISGVHNVIMLGICGKNLYDGVQQYKTYKQLVAAPLEDFAASAQV